MQTGRLLRNNFIRIIFCGLFFNLIFFSSCKNKIETSDTLSKQDIELIQKLKLLDKDERIYKFYSEFKKNVAGNFYTEKRIASYWLDEHDTSKNKIEFAYYKDIIKIDTTYFAGATYCSYLLVTRKDNSNFKICVEGEKLEITEFFNDAINKWTQHKN
jgi:hypothetical protein